VLNKATPQIVSEFTASNAGISIAWDSEVDLTDHDLEAVIKLGDKSYDIYPNTSMPRPLRGSGLNIAATVTIRNLPVFPDKDDESDRMAAERERKVGVDTGKRFISYNSETGVLIFSIHVNNE